MKFGAVFLSQFRLKFSFDNFIKNLSCSRVLWLSTDVRFIDFWSFLNYWRIYKAGRFITFWNSAPSSWVNFASSFHLIILLKISIIAEYCGYLLMCGLLIFDHFWIIGEFTKLVDFAFRLRYVYKRHFLRFFPLHFTVEKYSINYQSWLSTLAIHWCQVDRISIFFECVTIFQSWSI